MQTKLTLRLDEELIKRAKAWAKMRHIPLSQAVAEFFAQLPEKGPPPRLSGWTRRLAGVASSNGKAPTDEEIHRNYLDHLEAKHR
ncbi:MAG TPA: hypothetical protein ENI80_10565 [Acidiferrobacteraceae bacterium]|nr:hypothetical protein [Acidiferrobacteraceae bacterium]